MASLSMAFGAAAAAAAGSGSGRVFAATAAAKGAGSSGGEEKGLVDWILGGLQKQDQLLETDPILKKVEEKSGNGSKKSTTSVSIPKKKTGVFGGLFAKN